MLSFLDLCAWCEAQYDLCYYSGSNISCCAGNGVHEIWMRGRRATPKQRLVCGPCLAWVTRYELADLVGDTSPADKHVFTLVMELLKWVVLNLRRFALSFVYWHSSRVA